MSSLEKSDYELAVKLNTSEKEGANKQNELKQLFLFYKTPLLIKIIANQGGGSKYRVEVSYCDKRSSLLTENWSKNWSKCCHYDK